jgi:hypothetical protein
MTKQNKLIVGAVVVLGAYYLYSKNKTKMEVADLKMGASEQALGGGDRSTLVPVGSGKAMPLGLPVLPSQSFNWSSLKNYQHKI